MVRNGIKSPSAGVYPTRRDAFIAPPIVKLPVTASLSYWFAVAPPNSIFRLDPVSSNKSPVMLSVPAVAYPPGLMVPWLISLAALVPTTIVPQPDKIPVLVKPAVRVKIPPLPTSMVPD